MIKGKYEYFDTATRLVRSDGEKHECYLGNGKWQEISLNPYKRIDIDSGEWDFGETTEITSELALKNMMEFIDEAEKGKQGAFS